MRKLCRCGKPIVILSNKMETQLGTIDIEQVTDFGCLNKTCEMHKIIVDTKRQLLVQ